MSTSNTLKADPIVATDFKFEIDGTVFDKVMHWVHKAPGEVSGFGSVTFNPETKTFRVTDAYLLKQENSAASSEIDPVALGKLMYEKREVPNGLKWWWHSHVNMGVFWSGDDMNCIRGLGQQGWVTATVFNKKGEQRSAFYQMTKIMDLDHEMFVDEISLTVKRQQLASVVQSWDNEYEEQVAKYNRSTYSRSIDTVYDRGSVHPSLYSEGYDRIWPGHTSRDSEYERSWGIPDKSSEKRWAPAKNDAPSYYNGIPIDRWGADGWMWDSERQQTIYNPVRDTTISELEKWEEIQAMLKCDFDQLYEEDWQFKKFIDYATSSAYSESGADKDDDVKIKGGGIDV